MRKAKIVVVGAGHAGGRAVEAMRMLGHTGPIVLIGAEPHLPYERPPLSKDLLQHGDDSRFAPIHDAAWYAEQQIELRLGVAAVELDPDRSTVTLDDGNLLEYDRLLLATGGRVRRLSVPGVDLENIFYLRTLDESRALARKLDNGARLIVIGGGFIGLEVAASARMRGAEVVVLEAADRLMGRAVDEATASAFLHLHRERGVRICLGTTVVRIEGSGRVERIVASTGETIPADLVVIGIGIEPETRLAEDAGLATDDGILVDPYCRCSKPGIFAAGDATRHFNPLLGRRIRLESWQNAQNQAIAAARVICGEEAAYAEVPWVWSDQFDANLQIAGMPERWGELVYRGTPSSGSFIGFQLENGVVTAAIAMNRPRDMRFARRLIASRAAPLESDLSDENVSLKDLARTAGAR